MSNKDNNRHLIQKENIVQTLEKGSCFDVNCFELQLYSQTYAKICRDSLMRARITHDSLSAIAKYHMLLMSSPTISLALINRNMRIKSIELVSEGYRPDFTDFAEEIEYLCVKNKVKKCCVFFNFHHKRSDYYELRNLDVLYRYLKSKNIDLVDAIRFTEGKTTAIISIFNKSGYN